jgi:hypothetical protein
MAAQTIRGDHAGGRGAGGAHARTRAAHTWCCSRPAHARPRSASVRVPAAHARPTASHGHGRGGAAPGTTSQSAAAAASSAASCHHTVAVLDRTEEETDDADADETGGRRSRLGSTTGTADGGVPGTIQARATWRTASCRGHADPADPPPPAPVMRTITQ